MALSFFIQEGVVSTTTKKTGLAQLFNVTAWLKFALTSLGVSYYDPCEPTCLPTAPATIPTWNNETKPAAGQPGVASIGWNSSTNVLDLWTGSSWEEIGVL